ncbi:MAG: glycosyltransferase family 4 protein [Ignavibacteriae bacterium]|nr:glycosyltransferase family 4 protein [Ignavibacteria bacterium]MBI3363538.1 glycosyltransferase family 4 protein [Ignavibacteriota bacterium]
MKRYVDILFVAAFHAPFVQDDADTLEKNFNVKKYIGHGYFAVVKIILNLMTADVVFCWFASVYAGVAVLVGRVLGIKSVIVVGGVDVAKEPELNYGIWLSPWRAKFVRYALRHADRVLVVDPSLRHDATRLAEYDGQNIAYVPTGYDCEKWKPTGVKVPVVLTVAVVQDEARIKVKGLDVLLQAATRLPDTRFVIVGTTQKIATALRVPSNVTFHPLMEREKLLPFYQHAKVYCQPSRREGLPNTLCEAMLCGCIPVASNVGGNPTAVGQAGLLFPSGSVEDLVKALEHALSLDEQASLKARARIVSLFPKEKREAELVRIIEGLFA